MDESDNELVRQTNEEGPHEDDELEAAGTGSASSDSSLSVYLRGPTSLPQAPLPHQRPVIHPEGQKNVTLYVITTTSYDMMKKTNYFS